MRGRRTEGTTLVDLVVSCALFSVFMTVAIGLFTSMTRVVSREQKPAEQMMEARVAVLKVCRRIRNCKEMVSPTLREMMTGGDQSVIILRDRVLRRTVKFEVAEGILTETYYSLDYNHKNASQFKPIKALRLTPCREFHLQSGGFAHPTRMNVHLTTTDDRIISATTNFREAI